MAIYTRTQIDATWLDTRWAIGDTFTTAQQQQIVNACMVLSGQRWSASVYFATGWTFQSGYINCYIPLAGTGRQLLQPYFASNSNSNPGVALYTQGGTTLSSRSASTNASFTWPANLAAYSYKYAYGVKYPQTNTASTYRLPAWSGCGNVQFGPFTGSSPLTLGVTYYPQGNYTTNAGYVDYISSAGVGGPNIYSAPGQILLNAGVLRVAEEMLDIAESMPVFVCMCPDFSGVTSGPSNNLDSGLAACRQAALARWVPLVNLGRRRALWIAGRKNSSAGATIEWQINSYTGSGSDSAGSANVVFVSGNYRLMAIPVPPDCLRSNHQVGSIPLHYVRITAPQYINVSAWIGDAL